ncbi:MAG: hypothetical protein IKE63_01135 [Bacilli bacterium]|nr:hypothetical protein [Bacilli bacterium]
MKYKKLAIIAGIITILLAVVTILVVINNNKKINSNKKMLSEELIDRKDYKIISTNKEIDNIFNSIKKCVYEDSNRNTYKEFKEYELFSIAGYNVKKEDITNIKKEDFSIYGYVKRDILDNQIKAVFGTDKIKVSKEESNDEMININTGVFENVGNEFRNIKLISKTDDEYYFSFYAKEGTSGCPEAKSPPIKLVELRQIDNNIILVTKAVYTKVVDGNSSFCEVEIYDNYPSEKSKKVLDKIKVKAGSEPYDVDINKYVDDASEIYIILEKDKNGEYHFLRSEKGIIK